jgi:hypothetical protein
VTSFNHVKQVLGGLNLHLNNILKQSYDTSAVMQGEDNGC